MGERKFQIVDPTRELAFEKMRAYRQELNRLRYKARCKRAAFDYLDQCHLFEMEEAHYGPCRLTGEQKVMLGREAKERNKRFHEEFVQHVNDCIDRGIPRTLPRRHWKVIEKNVPPPGPPEAAATEPEPKS